MKQHLASFGWLLRWPLVISILATAACSPSADDPPSLRLVDSFEAATVQGTPDLASGLERTEWLFADGLDGWQAGGGIESLAAQDTYLVGQSSLETPVLHVEWPGGSSNPDVLEQVTVRARVSDGDNLSVSFSRRETLDFDEVLTSMSDFPWQLSSPLIPGEEFKTYTLRAGATARTSYPASSIRHVLLRPTDVAGAQFEIESVRLVFRREHLAAIPSGVSWQGLAEVYRESVVSRAPEDIRFEVDLPENPVLDLAFGTVEESPLTFRVSVVNGSGSDEHVLLERTLSTPNRWQEEQLDLAAFAGDSVVLSLQLEAEDPGAIGFWGAPSVRRRGARLGGASAPRNVVFIMIDTLRSDHLEAYGYGRETAPAIAKLASEGTLFDDAVAQGAWTKVSVPSMMSSTYPSANGVYELFHRLPASADTLAESFREAGYATWGASANGFSGRANNLHQGFEVLHERSSLVIPEGQPRAKTARLLNDRLLPWLDTHYDLPFFVFFHPIDPHSPYRPYRPYDTLWASADDEATYEDWTKQVEELVEERHRNGNLPHAEDLAELGLDADEFNRITLDWYDGSIRAADVEVSRLLQKLEELGLAEDTLVVFVSDHGEEFFDHGGGFHEDNVYGELVNVPLIFRWPAGLEAGARIPETVEMLDVVPTILELMGLNRPESMQGESLRPLLVSSGAPRSEEPVISEWKRRTDQLGHGGVDAQSLILGGFKLVQNLVREGETRPAGVAEFELYDHTSDPLDLNDVAAENPEVVARLADQLSKWRVWAESAKLPTDEEAAGSLDSEELDRLRSLGYLQ